MSIKRIEFTVPFLIASLLILSKYKNKIDIIIDFLLSMALITISPLGDFSGIPVLLLLLFRLKDSKHIYLLFGSTVVFICIGAIIDNWGITSIFVMLVVYSFFLFKYYYIIHLPTQALHNQIRDLQLQVSRIPTDQLTDDQILQKYSYMYYKQTDPQKDPDPYRKIKDLLLLADDKGYKEIAIINGISEQTQYREFAKLKKEFKIELNRDKKIDTLWGLIIAGQELGIIPVRYRHTEHL